MGTDLEGENLNLLAVAEFEVDGSGTLFSVSFSVLKLKLFEDELPAKENPPALIVTPLLTLLLAEVAANSEDEFSEVTGRDVAQETHSDAVFSFITPHDSHLTLLSFSCSSVAKFVPPDRKLPLASSLFPRI